MAARDLLRRWFAPPEPELRFSFQDYLDLMTNPWNLHLNTTITGDRESIGSTYPAYVDGAYKSSPIVFGIERLRMSVFSEARFMWRGLRSGKPGDLFATADLEVLRKPYPTATTGDLLSRAILDADIAGNHYAVRIGNKIKRLRPDWVAILYGSDADSEIEARFDPNAEVVAYVYYPGGKGLGGKPVTYLPEFIAHFAPIPDPLSIGLGMSWLTPVIRDIEADKQTTRHKNKFFEQGATPNMIVKFDKEIGPEKAAEFKKLFREEHEGAANAYKTLYLGGGADATVVGADFQQIDFAATTGKGENRIAVASGIHATLLGLSEGLQGSSLNAGNYGSARRSVADTVFRPMWRDLCGSYETIVPPPAGAQLWVDLDGVAFLREDQKDAAEIEQVKANSIRQLIDGGFDPDSVVSAVVAGDMSLLTHTGRLSVQLQDPNASLDAPVDSDLPDDFKDRVNAVGLLIRSGFKPEAALKALQLDPIEHFDLLPVTLQNPVALLNEGDPDAVAPDIGDLDPETELDPDEDADV